MRLKLLFIIAFLWLSHTSSTSSAETFNSAIEEGKSFGEAANASMPDAAEASLESVPGYTTSSPEETSYYGNPAAMGEASSEAASRNEAAQAVTEGFSSRPVFTIDPESDPMLRRMDLLEENAGSIAGGLQGEYSDCRPVTIDTPSQPLTDTCYENRQAVTTSCSKVLNIEIEFPTDTSSSDGPWTDSSGDCGPDRWSSYTTVSCTQGFYGPTPTAIYRQARWRTSHSWKHDTGWQPLTSAWSARTEISCSDNECSYRTKGINNSVVGPQWGNQNCGGDKWYTRMRLRVECRAAPIAHDVWENGCAELEARSQ